MNHKRKKIFIGPVEIAGYYANLAKGFSEIGVDCDYITFERHPFNYGGETWPSWLLRLAKYFNKFRGNPNRPFIVRALIALPGELLSGIWGIYAIFKYDVFIFGFGQSFFSRKSWDLLALKLLRKTIISNLAHGSEVRPPYIDGACQSKDGSLQPSSNQLLILSTLRFRKIKACERYSDVVLGAPFSTTHYASRRLINSFAIGIPFIASFPCDSMAVDSLVGASITSASSVRILHSPSHPALKGTPQILEAIQNLKEKGHAIDLILLHGQPHAEVLREIQHCDFVVDQVYSDTPMAGFATEAAWFGKPAVVGGYAFDYLKTLVPEGMWPPSKTCHPDEIKQAIEDLIVNREERLRLGTEAQRFVREKWSPAEVARRYLRLIKGDIPEEWWLDPNSVTYLEGGGQPVERTQENIRQMVAEFGVESLQLSHRPDMERAFLEFAGVKGVS